MSETTGMDRLAQAYDRMVERVHGGLHALERAEEDALPNLQEAVDDAVRTAIEVGELTREEAELIGAYVRRDLRDAGHFLAETGHGLREWLRFDVGYVEDRLLAMLMGAADKTRLEIERLALAAERAAHYRTGEITGPGSLYCEGCGKKLSFHASGRIPPCPACHGASYRRGARSASGG